MHKLLRATALALLIAVAAPAVAEQVTIGIDQGAEFDAIVDGFPMLAAFDGVPDFPTGYQTLSIGLQIGVTEERGIGEFPVAPLNGAAPEAVLSATLVFNIDDVIGTFGPGTSFRGSASQTILIHVYGGDGEITVDDHLAIDRPAHTVDTKPLGRITDQTLTQSGPLIFEIDVTDDVRAVLAATPATIGVVWRTNDSPSATSLDHLGDSGGGPPGVNGSFLPYLVIELGAFATATPTATAIPTATSTSAPTTSATRTATIPPTATATEVPTLTPTAIPTATSTLLPGEPTHTATATVPTATATATVPTPTATETADVPPCAGDCNGNRAVSVNELILGVTMSLGNGAASCGAMDRNDDGTISVNELISAVNAALSGC